MSEQKKLLQGGVDCYRYRMEVLRPKLLPFCKQVIEAYGECYLLKDGAASHIAEAKIEEYEIAGLRRNYWPANSPDLNMIEQAWFF